MKRILITGMSGTGKTAVVRELAARGFPAVDLDVPEWSEWVDVDPADPLTPRDGKDWVWREDPVRKLLSEHQSGTLFISGCAENMSRFFPIIELIVLLSAPMEVIMKRLEARSPEGHGNTYDERQKVRELISTIEPLLRGRADHEIDTTRSVDATVDEILRVT
ncbi:MAG: AAA family ATPase [Blastocatellia bacterium]